MWLTLSPPSCKSFQIREKEKASVITGNKQMMTLIAQFPQSADHFLCLFRYFTSGFFLPTLWVPGERLFQLWLWPLLVNTMIKTPSDHLLGSLEDLDTNDFEKFKFKLQDTSLEKDHSRIPWGQLENANRVKLATLMISQYGKEYALKLTLQVLRAMNQNLLAEELGRVIGPGK